MRGFLARAALAAPVLAAVALGTPPARADGPAGTDDRRPRATGAPLRAAGAPLARPGGPPFPPASSRAAGAPVWLGSAAQPLTRGADPWFGDDKARHFGASMALAGGGYALGALATDDLHGRIALGAALALGAGLAKEAYDAAGHGTPSFRDLVWDALGTTAGLGLSVWFDLAATPIPF
ncbi:hypothetical protein AB3662_36545 [Sorangium cellulosum]|uniref:hypothetical protein n=1 Tax=Sorangium cellulosum TaxID=56 RepID=UPI003D9A1E88